MKRNRIDIIGQNGNDGLHYKSNNMEEIKEMKEIKVITNDEIVDKVIYEFKDRSERGQEKYGTTLAVNNYDDFLQHAIEEAMDFTLYLKKIQTILKSKGYNNLNELNSISDGK